MSIFLVVLVAGTVGMFICATVRRSRFSMSFFQCAIFALLLTVVGVAGAKLMYAAENGFRAWDGVSFFGSVYLIPVVMPLTGLMFKLRPKQTMDLCAPCVAIMIACLRVGCFLTGCCGGWTVCVGSICFPWPTQMMDSIGDVLILLWMLNREENSLTNGRLYPYFMVFYGVMRFFIEFLRDTPKDWLMMSHGQWFSLAGVLVGAAWLILISQKEKRNSHV